MLFLKNILNVKNILFLFCFIALSCLKDETKNECNYTEKICSAIDELNYNKKKWVDSNITSYSMYFRISCFCVFFDPFSVSILENTIDNVSGNEEWGHEMVLTINDLFIEIEKRIYEDPFSFQIEYNTQYGYPESSFFDMVEMIADEEIGYYITSFNPL
ncbi:MAG: DUF6174 domain-containing protein [Flavobacteriaceae bacterium]|nr:DUF6174 domain-containing protein [Flavobacteriaceae bacterium]